jgi:DNA repair protein RecO (recombination protein O)
MKITDKAIVLSRLPYSETSLIVNLFTLESGLQTFLFQGAKKKKGLILFPLELVEITYYKRNDSSLLKLTEMQSLEPLHQLLENPLKSSIAFFVSELMLICLRDNHQDKKLFQFLGAEIHWLNASEELSNYLVWFLAQVSKLEGFQPEVQNKNPKYFELQEGKFTNELPFLPSYLEESWLHWLTDSLEYEKLDFLALSIPKEERVKLIDAWLEYYQFHVSGMRKMKSLEIIRTVFN